MYTLFTSPKKVMIMPSLFLALLLTILFSTSVFANGEFEDIGKVQSISKVSKSIIISGRKMLVEGDVQVSFGNKKGHLLNIVEVGAFISVDGRIDNSDNFIITSANIRKMPNRTTGGQQ